MANYDDPTQFDPPQPKASREPMSGPNVVMVPEGDNRERHVCPDCGFIDYRNPLVVVGAVCLWEDKILMCKRAIEPRKGYWTLPAGYMELNESTEQGAMREALEEACARIKIRRLLAVYNIPRISQVQLMYIADLVDPEIDAGVESEAVALMTWDEIPWDDLAFPTVRWALKHYRESAETVDERTRQPRP